MASRIAGSDDDDEVFLVPVGRPKQSKSKRFISAVRRVNDAEREQTSTTTSKNTDSNDQQFQSHHHSPQHCINHMLQVKDSCRTMNIPTVTKTLSASNLAALSDSNLSIQEALPNRSYDAPNTANFQRKQLFEQSVRQYYYQITEGCNNLDCLNKFCASSKFSDCANISPERALLLSIQLTVDQAHLVCLKEKRHQTPLNREAFDSRKAVRSTRAFFATLFTRTPFGTLFRRPDPPGTGGVRGGPASFHLMLPKPNIHRSRLGSVSLTPSLENLSLCAPGNSDRVKIVSVTRRDSVRSDDDDDDDVIMATRPRKLCRQMSSSLSNLSSAVTDFERFGKEAKPSVSFSNVYNYSLSQQLQLQVPSLAGSQVSLDASSACSDSVQFEYSDMDDVDLQPDQFESLYGQPAEFSLTHLTLPMLQCAMEKFAETQDASFILNTIRTVFTSSEALNNSFKKDESLPSGGTNLDHKAVRKAYELLVSQDQFVSRLNNSIEILLSSLSTQVILVHDVSQLAILLECPLFRRRRNHALRQRYCAALGALQPDSRAALGAILVNYDSKTFEKRMGIFHDHFMLSLRAKQRLDENNRVVAEALSIFYLANCLAEERTGLPVIAHKLFYVNDLGRKLDFKSEYQNWAKSYEGGSREPSFLDYPFLLDASSKVHALHLDAVTQMRTYYMEAILHQARVIQVQKYLKDINRSVPLPNAIRSAMCPYLVLDVRRDDLIADAISQIRLKQMDLKKPLKIKYVGGGEMGFDMGGPQKEFFQLVCADIFDPDYGMFAYCEETRNLWINGASTVNDDKFEFVGILLGLAIYNGIILDVRFPPAIYKKLQDFTVALNDLMDIEPTICRGYTELLLAKEDVENIYCLNFQISAREYDQLVTRELIPGGAAVLVNNANRSEFVRLAVDYYLNTSIAKHFSAFKSGFQKVCDTRLLSLFRHDEIELLVCGSPHLDFEALEKYASYDEGFHKDHRVVRWFWTVVHQYNLEKKRLLLNFITGSDRVPLKGLSQLPILIQRNGEDSDRLPTAMTCFNRLLIPDYSDHEKLAERLGVAISHGQGFGLT